MRIWGFFSLELWLISGLSYISAWLSFKVQYGSVILGSAGEFAFFGAVANVFVWIVKALPYPAFW